MLIVDDEDYIGETAESTGDTTPLLLYCVDKFTVPHSKLQLTKNHAELIIKSLV